MRADSPHVPARPPTPSAASLQQAIGTSRLPRPEYPRPDRDRSHRWLSLNGTWQFLTDEGPSDITVPFAWETIASGVSRTWLERATYRRRVTVPADWAGCRVILCFGAVHHEAHVLLDGQTVARHSGGHTSFEIDLTDHLAPGARAGAELEVEVVAPADKRSIPHGKQRSIPRDDYDGVSFTPTSGIWQSVWLEGRSRTHLDDLAVRGDSLTGFDLHGHLVGDQPGGTPVTVTVTAGSTHHESVVLTSDADGMVTGRLEVVTPRAWSPSDPHLYTLTCTTPGDETSPGELVHFTAGLRSITLSGEQLYLNGERLYVRGVLDQGYWPSTGLTGPDDDALLADLHLARDLGYNLVRKHIKLEEPRWLHHADRLGMLVWAEPPGPSRWSPKAAQDFEAQLAPMVERDGNHPCIVTWGLYNEEWGLDWNIPGSPERAAATTSAYDRMTSLDPTRPVVDNSGWAHVRTDLVDWHYYDEDPRSFADNVAGLADGTREDFPVRLGPDYLVHKSLYAGHEHPRTGIPLLNSEYGAGFTSLERAWHLRWQTQELRRHDRFAGYVYTELTDVEHEMAGLVDADRRPKDRGGLDPGDVNAETILVLDIIPAAAGADIPVPKDDLVIVVRVSHHGERPIEGRMRAAWTPAGTLARHSRTTTLSDVAETHPVKAEPFVLSLPVEVAVPSPGLVNAARLHLWLVDEDDRVRARAFIDAAPIEEPNRPNVT